MDRYGNPLPARPLHPDEEENLIPLPGFEHLIGSPVVPSSAGRAELHEAIRPRRARKEKPRPLEYRFWGEVRVGDQVEVDGLNRGEVLGVEVEVEKEGDTTYVKEYALVLLTATGEELRVNDQTRMKRIPEGA